MSDYITWPKKKKKHFFVRVLLLVLRTYLNNTACLSGPPSSMEMHRVGLHWAPALAPAPCLWVCAWNPMLIFVHLHVCVSAGCFGRLMSGQLSGHLACTQTSTLRHVAVNDCFISLRQRRVVTTRGVLLCVRVCVRAIGKGGLNSCGQKMDRGRYQI